MAFWCAGPAQAQFSYFEATLTKSVNFDQDPCALPVLRPVEAYSFVALVVDPLGVVTSATVAAPGRSPVSLDNESQTPDGMHLFTTDQLGGNYYSNRTELERVWPSGDYLLTVEGLLGSDDFGIPFSGDAYPHPPTVLNYGAAQRIQPNRNFTLNFEPFGQPGNDDIIQLGISTSPNNPDFILVTNVAATSVAVTIPAGLLAADTTYYGALTFLRQATNLYPLSGMTLGILGASYSASTAFLLKTAGSAAANPGAPTRLSASVAGAGGEAWQVSFETQPGCCYWVLASSDLTRWFSIYTTNAFSDQVTYSASRTTLEPWRFFRVISQ